MVTNTSTYPTNGSHGNTLQFKHKHKKKSGLLPLYGFGGYDGPSESVRFTAWQIKI